MDFKTIPTNSIIEWDKNTEIRDTTPEIFEQAKNDFIDKPQYDPIFVGQISDDKYVCFAGNHRLRIYKELKVPEVWVRIIQTKQLSDGMWCVTIDGQEDPNHFTTELDALMDFAVSRNQPLAHYILDNFLEVKDNYNLNWDNYYINFNKPEKPSDLLKKFGIGGDDDEGGENEDKPKKGKEVTCPNCNHKFTA